MLRLIGECCCGDACADDIFARSLLSNGRRSPLMDSNAGEAVFCEEYAGEAVGVEVVLLGLDLAVGILGAGARG